MDERKEFLLHLFRTDAWCGDMGLALYLQSCLRGDATFPMLDYL